MARQVAESRPPDSSTTAGRVMSVRPGRRSGCSSSAALRAPQHFVKLELHAHRQTVAQYPLRQPGRRKAFPDRRKQHRAALRQAVFVQLLDGPAIVGLVGEHELDFVARGEKLEILQAVLGRLARARRLEVHDPGDAGIDAANIERTARLQRYRISRVAEHRQQARAGLLCQGFAAGDADRRAAEVSNPLEDGLDGHRAAPGEGVLGVAPDAAQRATGQPHEYRRQTGASGLALDRVENLADAQWRLAGGHCFFLSCCLAVCAALLVGYLATRSSRVLRASLASPASFWQSAMASSASGALASSGHCSATWLKSPAAALKSRSRRSDAASQ